VKFTFQNRFEKKYLVPSSELPRIAEVFSDCLIPDPYSSHLNNGYYNQSVYYDTANFGLYREKIEGLNRRQKYRLRGYKDSIDLAADTYHLELKARVGHINKKIRTIVSSDMAKKLVEGGRIQTSALWHEVLPSNAVLHHFFFVSQKYDLRPVVTVLYKRTAFVSSIYRDLRITFDTNVRASPIVKLSPPLTSFLYVLDPRYSIVELKYSGAVPNLVSRRFLELGMTQITYSKYASSVGKVFQARRGE